MKGIITRITVFIAVITIDNEMTPSIQWYAVASTSETSGAEEKVVHVTDAMQAFTRQPVSTNSEELIRPIPWS
jgi:hypothetical protein